MEKIYHHMLKNIGLVCSEVLYRFKDIIVVALGTTTIDSTPTIGVGWRRVPIQPAKYLHLWLSVKLVPTGFQNSRPLFRSQRPDHFRRGDRRRGTSTHRSQKRRKEPQSLDQL